jgi:hypothetical protein
MAALPTLAQSPIVQPISRHGVLCMWGFGLHLQVRNGHLSAEWGIGEERHNARLPRVNSLPRWFGIVRSRNQEPVQEACFLENRGKKWRSPLFPTATR